MADVAFIGAAVTIGALCGAFVYKVGGIPITLSTAGGALFSGLFFGWLRSVKPTFGRIPSPTVWFMNSVGLNIFIAIIGIASGPAFVAGLQKLGFSLFAWGMVATAVPLILGMFVGKYIFKFHDALLLGIVSGSRTTTASLGMVVRPGQEPDSGARLHRDLRGRQHAADHLGHGDRHDAVLTRSDGHPTSDFAPFDG